LSDKRFEETDLKRAGLPLLCFGVYIFSIPLLLKELDGVSLLPLEFAVVDLVSDVLMVKFGILIALFGFLAFFAANAAHAARRVRKRFEGLDGRSFTGEI
jgi:hypothetical protein